MVCPISVFRHFLSVDICQFISSWLLFYLMLFYLFILASSLHYFPGLFFNFVDIFRYYFRLIFSISWYCRTFYFPAIILIHYLPPPPILSHGSANNAQTWLTCFKMLPPPPPSNHILVLLCLPPPHSRNLLRVVTSCNIAVWVESIIGHGVGHCSQQDGLLLDVDTVSLHKLIWI